MDNITSRLTQMLSDPEQLESLKQMAGSLLGSENAAPPPPKSELPPDISPEMLSGIAKAAAVLKNQNKDDKNTVFLQALRPLLSPNRREKVDTALKFIKIFSVLPLLQDSGIFNMLL